MIEQLRVYTVNRGMMDQWVKYFNENVVPIMTDIGIKVSGQWVNSDGNQFIWIRSFSDADDLKAKEKAFYDSPAWQAVQDKARSHLARIEVHQMEPVAK